METNIKTLTPQSPSERGNSWGRRIVLGGVAIVALAGIGAASAASGSAGPVNSAGMALVHARMGGGFAEYRLEKALEFVDATAAQTEKVKNIFDAARSDIMPMVGSFSDTRQDVAEILGAGIIDRAAAERLRSERVAAIDEVSRRMTAAMLDAAEVLTSEQRTKLLEHLQERGSHRRW